MIQALVSNIEFHCRGNQVSYLAAQDTELLELARSKGAQGINLAGVCCTGNEVLMRKGIPMAGNHLMQELVIMSGAVEAMVVDYQCIMPAVTETAKCFHTKVISTFDKAKFPGAEHISFDPARGLEIGRLIVRTAFENFANRVPGKVFIPVEPGQMMTGFSIEAILGALGATPKPLIDAIVQGAIRGAVGVVAFGGIPAAYPNETGIKSVSAVTGKKTVNIAGCPPHPDWFTWAVVQILLNKPISLDSYGRPTYLYGKTVHELCPRRESGETNRYGQEGRCLEELGCKGPETRGNCPTVKWNNKVSWCIDANAICIGCTNPDFPSSELMGEGEERDND